MTRIFEYTFKTLNGELITLRKRVTDKMEERDSFKAGYASRYFNEVLRERYGYHKSVVTASRITQIKRSS